jgi:alpha-1,2-mannosyltransferase
MNGALTVAQGLSGKLHGGGGLNRRRVCACAAILLRLELVGLAFCVAGTHGWIVPLKGPISTDFVSFYAAGRLADEGTPALVYQPTAHHAAEQAATEPGIAYNFFYYPPVFILLCAIFARLPYLAAFMAFQAATLLPCLLVARRILSESGWASLLRLLAFPAVFYTIGTGQNAFLTAALFGAATLLVDGRPVLAGMLFGALCYKPHFGLLVPVALAAGGRWKCFAAAAMTAAALIGVSVLTFGLGTWRAFFAAAAGAHRIYETSISHAGMATPFGVVLLLGGSPALACELQAIAALAMISAVGLVWRRGQSLPIRAAVLAAATPIALPVVLFYDLMLSGIALAWLVRWGQQHGFPAWSRTMIATLYGATSLSGNFDPHSYTMTTPLIAAGTVVLALLAAAAEARQQRINSPSVPISGRFRLVLRLILNAHLRHTRGEREDPPPAVVLDQFGSAQP